MRPAAQATHGRGESSAGLVNILLFQGGMASAHTLRLVFTALFFCSAAWPARALQLGESKTQTIARHGAPGAEDRGKDVAIYFWEGWSAELEFKTDVVRKLIYRRNTYLQDAEVTALLHSNGGLSRWRETTPEGEPTRLWQRDDGATANCLAVRPLMMIFHGGKPLAASAAPSPSVTPTVVVTLPAAGASSTPPTFPKLLGSVPPPEAAPAPTPFPMPDSLPRLEVEEVATPSGPPAGRSESTVEPPQTPVAAVTQPPAPERAALPLSESASAEDDSDAGELRFLLGLLVVLAAAAGGGIYLLKARAGHTVPEKTKSSTPAARNSGPKPAPTVTPALDALRGDQFELVVGEIFRREGYTVELSAAVAHDDSIDLTLRRNAETILVQCKHWKTARVSEREVREFYGAMMANGAPRGIFVTAGSFTRDAQEFAEGKEIDLMDRAALEESTAAVARPGENFCKIAEWIGEFTAHAHVFDPECPICQGSMVIRHNRANGAASWSCRHHPRCPGRREPRLDLLAAAVGH